MTTFLTNETKTWLAAILGAKFEYEKHDFSHQDDVYKIHTPGTIYYLKIAKTLKKEHDNIEKVSPYLLMPRGIAFEKIGSLDHLLMSEVPGKNLAELAEEWGAAAITKEFARAVKKFHSLNVHKFFPDTSQPDMVVLHGDMSLPNIIATQPGAVGYIDLAQMSVGTPDIDLADAIWSLQRNLGPGHGEAFLAEYGETSMTSRVEKALRFRYNP